MRCHADSSPALPLREGISAPGEDENVFNHVPELDTPQRMQLVADRLAARGHPSARIEKIIGANWLRLFGEVWGSCSRPSGNQRGRRGRRDHVRRVLECAIDCPHAVTKDGVKPCLRLIDFNAEFLCP